MLFITTREAPVSLRKERPIMAKKIVTSIMIGFILGLTVIIVGFFSIVSYGLAHTPWQYHPLLASVSIMDFTAQANGSFSGGIGSGMLGVFLILTLIFTAISFLLQAVFRPAKKEKGHEISTHL